MVAVLEKAPMILSMATKLAIAIAFASLGLMGIAKSSSAQNEIQSELQGKLQGELQSDLQIIPDDQLRNLAVPEPDDIPEELLRTEIITEARSPLTGEPLSAAEYAQLLESIQNTPADGSLISSEIRQLIQLLQIRRTLRPVLPFIP